MRGLEERISSSKLLMHTVVEDDKLLQKEFATTSANLWIAQESLAPAFHQLKQHNRNVELAEIAVQI